MTAYAAVVTLMDTIHQIQTHPQLSNCFNQTHMESLREYFGFLQELLEQCPLEAPETTIATAAYDADDLIRSIVARKPRVILSEINNYLIYLNSIIVDIKTEVKTIQGKSKVNDQKLPRYSKLVVSSSRSLPTGKTAMVGLEKEVILLMDRLTGGQSSRQVIPIVGMGGIGKTALARCVYEKPLIVHYFDTRIWITISQQFTLRDLLLQIPICRKQQEDSKNSLTDDQLGDVLYKCLSGKRYLIIIDDIWDTTAWNNLKLFFPDNNGTESRILVTTRLSNLAYQFSSSVRHMALLDQSNSWKLFCENAFGQEGCPQEFEEIGNKIVEKCQGLPLSIVVIGGLLAKSQKTREFWETVASAINSILNSGDHDEHCKNVLLLSYYHLTAHLKPCFLYFGIFLEDHQIRVSHLIQLWIAEGFLKPDKDKSLEIVAEGYLKDLADRNLISVGEWGLNGKMKKCYLHDLLRDLCLRMAKREEFISVFGYHDITQGKYRKFFSRFRTKRRPRRVAFHAKYVNKELHFASQVRKGTSTLMGVGVPIHHENRLLRVLDAIEVNSFGDVFQQINLRYLGCCLTSRQSIPSSISLLWNLQTIRCQNIYITFAPIEIWTMKQLCHVQFSEICLPDPPTGHVDDQDGCVLENLQTLMNIVNLKCTEDVLRRIPCIKKLKIKYEELNGESKTGPYYGLYNLHQFVKLESLHIYFYVKQSVKRELQRCLTYPSSLKKLALDNIELCWDDLEMIGRLPHLEALRLKGFIAGDTWNPSEGGFCSLRSLRISAYIELISWNADESHFPVLETLDLGYAPRLDEICADIGEIQTLKVICLGGCQASTAISALNILVKQESFGNEGLQVKVSFLNSAEEGSFQERAKSEGLASDNFVVESVKW